MSKDGRQEHADRTTEREQDIRVCTIAQETQNETGTEYLSIGNTKPTSSLESQG